MEEKLGRELTLRETQLAALEVMKVVDRICTEQGLRYYLAYGTLIGAVRHHGFIPWDDDLDIYMPRPDYEALLGHFAEHAAEFRPFVAINANTVERCPFLITRISDTRYRMVGECGLDVDEMGAFIDVYPLDGLGNDPGEARRLVRRCRSLMKGFTRSGGFKFGDIGKSAPKRVLKASLRRLLQSPDYYVGLQATLLSGHSFDSSKYCNVAVWGADLLALETSCFETAERVPFEDVMLSIPQGYDALLTSLYGDYMALPPEEERVGHHAYRLCERRNFSKEGATA